MLININLTNTENILLLDTKQKEVERNNFILELKLIAQQLQQIIDLQTDCNNSIFPNDNKVYTLLIKNNNIVGIDKTK